VNQPTTDDFGGSLIWRDQVTSLELIEALGASGIRINGSFNLHLGTAMRKIDWTQDSGNQSAKRARSRKTVNGNKVTVYYPTQAELLRRKRITADETDFSDVI
jgi:hypothetical protein